MEKKMKRLVIDTDPGVDDAQAILIAAAHPDAKIEAITTVCGNVPLHHTTANALKILDVAELNVPVFAGCDRPLVQNDPERAAHVHGEDGLGDCGIPESSRNPEKEHAVQALIRLADENPGELTLVAIGPLTNLALATRLDPTLPQKYKELVIMGGAIYAQGNTQNLTAEFNFFHDPEAAAIVLNTWPSLTLASWEATLAHPISIELLEKFKQMDTARGRFLNAITAKTVIFIQEILGRQELYAADSVAMVAAIEPSTVIKAEKKHVHVELAGTSTRGQTVVDWFGLSGKTPNTQIILELDRDRFNELMLLAHE
jgi:purine nucleosidase